MKSIKGEYTDFSFLLHAVFAWIISAMTFLLLASILLNMFKAGERSLAYVSSAISFLSAVCAGLAAVKQRMGGGLPCVLISAAAITTALLTVGFMIKGNQLDPSAVLSVISFTFAGCIAGAMVKGGHKKGRKKYYPKP